MLGAVMAAASGSIAASLTPVSERNGQIIGIVINKDTGDRLEGATVKVDGPSTHKSP